MAAPRGNEQSRSKESTAVRKPLAGVAISAAPFPHRPSGVIVPAWKTRQPSVPSERRASTSTDGSSAITATAAGSSHATFAHFPKCARSRTGRRRNSSASISVGRLSPNASIS